MNPKEFESLKELVDDTEHVAYVKHIHRGNKDVCLETFGEEDEECRAHNQKLL